MINKISQRICTKNCNHKINPKCCLSFMGPENSKNAAGFELIRPANLFAPEDGCLGNHQKLKKYYNKSLNKDLHLFMYFKSFKERVQKNVNYKITTKIVIQRPTVNANNNYNLQSLLPNYPKRLLFKITPKNCTS